MKRILIALLLCSFMLFLTACGTAQCMGKGCSQEVKKSRDNESPLGGGYLCEECMSKVQGLLDEMEAIADDL